MKPLKFTFAILLIVILTLISAPRQSVILAQSSSRNDDAQTIFQVSTYDYFAAGNFDGIMPLSQLHQYGDIGVGTFDKIDGEMVFVDDTIYQVPVSGKPQTPDPALTTPYAIVAFWQPASAVPVKAGISLQDLTVQIDQVAPNQDAFVIIRVDGEFSALKLRSVPAQHVPYPTLADVVKQQVEFDNKFVRGTLVGVRAPLIAKGLNTVGYHFHFISTDHRVGGHVLELTTSQVSLQVNIKPMWKLLLPNSPAVAPTMAATASATAAR